MSDTLYRSAVVGCGRIGMTMEEDPKQIKPATHARAFSNHPRVTLAGLVDIDPAKLAHARECFPDISTFLDAGEMLGSVNPNIVSVATPPAYHRAVVELCALGGVKAIICEKPIAETREDAEEMVDLCARRESLLFINHVRRFDPMIREARAEVISGSIGQVLQATCYYTAGLWNTGTHVVDLLRFFLGEVSWVLAVPNDGASHPPGDVSVDAIVGFVSGARATLQSLEVGDYSIFDIRFYGRKGSLVLTRFGYEIERTGVVSRSDVSGYNELDGVGKKREGEPRSFMAFMVNHVVDCLDGCDHPVSRGEEGLAVLEILLALRESAARGGIRVDLSSARLCS